MSTPLLILDLDETLIHALGAPLAHPPDFGVGPYVVYQRPHVGRFLEFCLTHFEVAVWTTATASYAVEVVAHLFPDPGALSFVWSRTRCTRRFDLERQEAYWIKDLKKVKRHGYPLERTLVVDDNPRGHVRNYGNLVPVAPFLGDPHDHELALLIEYLPTLKAVENVRRLEKRHWRSMVQR